VVVLLLLILAVGSVGMGAERWSDLGPVHFQPSELGKLALVLALARLLTDQRKNPGSLRVYLLIAVFAGIPWMLVVLEPDLGTSLSYLFLVLPLLVAGGVPLLHLVVLLSPLPAVLFSFQPWLLGFYLLVLGYFLWRTELGRGALLGALFFNLLVGVTVPRLWHLLHGYQQKRILTFLNPDLDPLGAGYQIIQSKVAVGSGGWWGKGLLHGTQVQLDFLPAKHTDFIFSVLSEEFGFLGSSLILALFGLLVLRLLFHAWRHRNRFSGLCLVGISALFFFHVLVNVGMTLGILPVTGLPLPFLSYGGSFLLSNFFVLGLALNFVLHYRDYT